MLEDYDFNLLWHIFTHEFQIYAGRDFTRLACHPRLFL